MEDERTMDEYGVKAKSRIILISKRAGGENQALRARADKDPPGHLQGDHRGGQPTEGQEEEDRVAEAASPQRDSQVEEEIQVSDKEGGRMGLREKNQGRPEGRPQQRSQGKGSPRERETRG